jgi:hypothetical protein
MISVENFNHALRLIIFIVFALLFALAVLVISGHAQTGRVAAPAAQTPAPAIAATALRDYRGVNIGMTQIAARAQLGQPSESLEGHDFYFFSETESAQVYYDAARNVRAISINYLGEQAPTPQQVLGVDVAANPDGSISKLITYPQAGYWVAYNRTAGSAPLVAVSLQRIVQ